MRWSYILPVVGVLAAAVAALGFFYPPSTKETLNRPGVVEVQEVRLSSKVAGRIKSVGVREGDRVSPGQPLIYLDLPELEAQRDQVKAKLAAAQAALAKSVAGPRTLEKAAAEESMKAARARVERLEAGCREEEKEQARAEVQMWQAELEPAQLDSRREQQLQDKNYSTAQRQEAAVANFTRVKAQLRSAQARLSLTEKGPRQEEIAEAKAELARTMAQYNLLCEGTRREEIDEANAAVGELQARLRELEAQLAETVIMAPDEAVVDVVAVRAGELVTPGQPLVRVLRSDDVWVKAFISEIDLGRVRLNQEVAVTCDAYPGREFKGTVTYIAGTGEFTPRNVQTIDERRHQVFAIKVRVADSLGVFKSGMAANVKLPVN